MAKDMAMTRAHNEEKWIVSGSASPVDELKLDVPAFLEGMKAFSEGVGFYQNPYEPKVIRYNNPSAIYWRNGFLYGHYETRLRSIDPRNWPQGNPLLFLFWDGKKWTQDVSLVRKFTSLPKAKGIGQTLLGAARRNAYPPLGVIWLLNLSDLSRSFPLPEDGRWESLKASWMASWAQRRA